MVRRPAVDQSDENSLVCRWFWPGRRRNGCCYPFSRWAHFRAMDKSKKFCAVEFRELDLVIFSKLQHPPGCLYQRQRLGLWWCSQCKVLWRYLRNRLSAQVCLEWERSVKAWYGYSCCSSTNRYCFKWCRWRIKTDALPFYLGVGGRVGDEISGWVVSLLMTCYRCFALSNEDVEGLQCVSPIHPK